MITRSTATALIAAALLATSAVARAEDEEDTGRSEEGRVSVAIFVLADDELSAQARATLVRGLEKGLKPNRRITVKETDLLLAQFSGDVPVESIAEARALHEAGAALVADGKHEAAVRKLEAAETSLENVLGYVRKSELAETQFLLGVAYLGAGMIEEADAAFQRLQVWRRGYVVDVAKYPKVLPAWEKVRERVEGLGRGSIEVRSEPPGAMAFVDGKYVGVTPTRAEGLVAGDHYVTLKKEGHRRRVMKATVDTTKEGSVREALPRSEKYLLVSQSLERARPDLGERDASPAMQDLRTFLFIDQAIYVVAHKGTRKTVEVDAFLYDLRSKRRLSAVKDVEIPAGGSNDDIDHAFEELGDSLYGGVRYDGRTEEDDRLARRAKSRRRVEEGGVTSKWWFWTILGVTAGVAVPVGLYLGGAFDGPAAGSCPDGTACGEVLIRY